MSHDIDALHARLCELRTDALRQLSEAAPTVDLGVMRIVADVTAVLAVLDAEPGALFADRREMSVSVLAYILQ